MASDSQLKSVQEQPTVVLIFDREKGRYSVNGGSWLVHGFIQPPSYDKTVNKGSDRPGSGQHGGSQPAGSGKPESSKPGSSQPGNSAPPNEDILRCLRSEWDGHTDHCHWHVWDGARWIDLGKENCGSCP
jgi:hypothetical protein